MRKVLAPGHDAVAVVRRLVELLDAHPIVRQFMRSVPDAYGLRDLERKARTVVMIAEQPAEHGPDHSLAWCPSCRALHDVAEPDRSTVPA